jgi:hypothetical protein
MPPKTTLDQAYHFGMFMMKAVLDGRATQLIDLAKVNLSRWSDLDRARAALEATKSRKGSDIRINPALIESFGRTMRESLTTGSTPFRKVYLRSLIDVIEVDDAQVRIKGSKDVLKSGCGQPAGNCHVGLDMPHDAADFTDREAL